MERVTGPRRAPASLSLAAALLLAALGLMAGLALAGGPALPKAVSAEELAALMAKPPAGLEIVDIRPAAQFADYSLPGSLNLEAAVVLADESLLGGSGPLVLVDKDGSQAFAVAGVLAQKATRPVMALSGGALAWWAFKEKGVAVREVPLSGATPTGGSPGAAPTTPAAGTAKPAPGAPVGSTGAPASGPPAPGLPLPAGSPVAPSAPQPPATPQAIPGSQPGQAPTPPATPQPPTAKSAGC